MLQVQNYLREQSLDDLIAQLGIKVSAHPDLPLVILNYDQIESPKTHPIVRETRGLVLNSQDYSLVARSFPRFFNWGEVKDEMDNFDFSDFVVHSKEDGSLVIIYHFNGDWYANTRGSFALDQMQFQDFSWRDGICRALGVSDLNELDGKLDRNISYVCEFVSPWNKVVRTYREPKLYLLGAFRGEFEVPHNEVDLMVDPFFKRPDKYAFNNIEGVQEFLQLNSANDPTFEGVVICDKNGLRYKVKSATYLGLHRLRGEGDGIYNPKNLLPFVLNGETDELLTYFPEVADSYYKLKDKVDAHYDSLLNLWKQHKDLESQKDFALAVKDHPYSSILFNVRKKLGKDQTERDLRKEFLDSPQLIIKKI